MKKVLSVLLLLCVMFACVACGKDKADADDRTATKTEKSAEVTEEILSDGLNAGETESETSDAAAEEKSESGKFDFKTDPIKFKSVEPVKPADARIKFDVADFELNMVDNLSDEDRAKVSKMSIEEKKALLEKKKGLLTGLISGFKAQNVDVMINETSGEIVMDSSILFENDKAEVSDTGKAFLAKFATAYASVICNEHYKGFISKIVVEGHTDTNGSYDYNMKLSENRAENVKEICLSDAVKLPAGVKAVLSQKLDSVGCSYDRPVLDANGNVDMDASRRVTFRFMINVK